MSQDDNISASESGQRNDHAVQKAVLASLAKQETPNETSVRELAAQQVKDSQIAFSCRKRDEDRIKVLRSVIPKKEQGLA